MAVLGLLARPCAAEDVRWRTIDRLMCSHAVLLVCACVQETCEVHRMRRMLSICNASFLHGGAPVLCMLSDASMVSWERTETICSEHCVAVMCARQCCLHRFGAAHASSATAAALVEDNNHHKCIDDVPGPICMCIWNPAAPRHTRRQVLVHCRLATITACHASGTGCCKAALDASHFRPMSAVSIATLRYRISMATFPAARMRQ